MNRVTLFVFGILGSLTTMGAPSNTMLQFTMKAISKDTSYVAFPAKQESPLDVTEEALVTAIARARTAAFQLQLVIDRKDGELCPILVQNLPETEKKAKLELFAEHLRKAVGQLSIAETQLLAEHAKADPAARDFQALQKTLENLDKVIKAAHAVFHPHA